MIPAPSSTEPGPAPVPVSTTDGGEPVTGSPPPHGRARSAGRLLVLAAAVLLLGAALGRFVLFSPPAVDDLTVALPGPAERVVALEARAAQRPDDIAAWQGLGLAYTQRAAETGDPAFYALAQQTFDRADTIEADAFDTLVGRGALALSLHDFTDALELGQRALALAPGNADALGVVVDAQVELGRYDEAAATLQRMLDRNPGVAALSRTSYLRELHGDLVGAGRAMQQALVSARAAGAYDAALVEALLGDLLLLRGDVTAASDAYARAADTLPTLVEAQIGRARIAVARGDLQRGVDILGPVVERIPRPDAVILQADLLRLTGSEDDAAAADALARTLTALQEAGGQDVDLELALFEADRATDPERSVALARRAHAARPDNVFAADALAWALHRAGRTDEALPLTAHAVRRGTASPLLRTHAALITEAAGQDETARDHLRELFTMSPWTVIADREAVVGAAERLGVEVPAVWMAP